MTKKRGVRIVYNKKLLIFIILLLIALILVIYLCSKLNVRAPDNQINKSAEDSGRINSSGGAIMPRYSECGEDSDCVPANCCHAESCSNIKQAPDCSRTFCTQECSGVLDCGRGKCSCKNNKCEVTKTG